MIRQLFCILSASALCLFQFHAEAAQKIALIFGASGQDGTYLSEFLLAKNYEVHGVSRSIPSADNNSKVVWHAGDVTNYSGILKLLQQIRPDEIYNLAAQSNVKTSFGNPEETFEINGLGTLRILEAIRVSGLEKSRYFQAASSELFGHAKESPQTEKTPFSPNSPYGIAKLYSYWITVNYRESYNIFGCNAILFNHESPLRGENFVTRKITLGACRIKLGLQDVLFLGNMDVKRDWGYAKDYVEAMWLMLQQDKPDDYVIASGESHSVREFVELAFKELDIDIQWKGNGINEIGIDKKTGKTVVKIDPKYYRPVDNDFAAGNAFKAEKALNWKPKTKFHDLVKLMVAADFNALLKQDECNCDLNNKTSH